jgi:hypothetical protein
MHQNGGAVYESHVWTIHCEGEHVTKQVENDPSWRIEP